MNNFAFGMSKLRITQNYHQTVSHKYHWYNSKNYADYPIDIAGIDSNKDIYYAPFIALTHWNDNDPHIKELKVGSIVKAGQPIC